MDSKPYLENYDGQSVHELIEYAKVYSADSIVAAFVRAFEQRRAKGDTLSRVETNVCAIFTLEAEIYNCGFHFFLDNFLESYALMVADALKDLGLNALAEIYQNAIDELNLDLTDLALVREKLECDDGDLEEAFFTLEDKFRGLTEEPLAGVLLAYLKANKDQVMLRKVLH